MCLAGGGDRWCGHVPRCVPRLLRWPGEQREGELRTLQGRDAATRLQRQAAGPKRPAQTVCHPTALRTLNRFSTFADKNI